MSTTSDVAIVGAGVIGAATAFFLARDHGCRVTLVERDPSFRRASSALSASSIRQQFSTPLNIALSQQSFAFLQRIDAELALDPPPQLSLVERGYLYLATGEGVDALRANVEVQRQHGAATQWLTAPALTDRFPWLRVDDLAAGALGSGGEGWFDGPALHAALLRAARRHGATLVHADVQGFDANDGFVQALQTSAGRIAANAVVIAAGAWSAPLASRLGIALPVRARKRDVFVIATPAHLPDCPLVIDPCGLWFRPEGALLLAGAPPRGGAAADRDDLPLEDIDHGLWDDWLWPRLAHRVPALEAARVRRAWAGYYEMNTVDQNGIVGAVPGWHNAFAACGFSGHGMQHAPAIGRGLAELIATGGYRTLDLAPLSPARLARGERIIERNVI